MVKNDLRSLLAGILAMAFIAIPAYSQGTDTSEKPRTASREMKDVFKRWLNEDVPYIITEAERDAFRRLTTDEERESFIATFWRLRDPDPDTEENEFREEYYERIAYANEHFSSGIPGWKTDRGRVFIRWGKPDSIESHPTGGAYDRPGYEGGGSTSTYPFEVWFYRNLETAGNGVEVEFVDPSGTGEYRIARNADEKDALAMVPNAGLKTREMLGIDPKANRLNGNNVSYQREQDSPFSRLNTLIGLETPPRVKYSDLDAMTRSEATVLNEDPIPVDHRIDFFRLSDGRVIAAFTLEADNRSLNFESIGGIETARLNIFGRVTSVSGKRSGIFEDSVTTTALRIDLAEKRERKSIYQKSVVLSPGTYKIDLAVRDVATGNKGIVRQGFTVPRYDDEKLSTSTLLLASTLRPKIDNDIGAMFVIGSAKVVPNISGVYKQGQPVGIFMQVYNAGIDQTTLKPAIDVEYHILQHGKEILRQLEDWGGLSDSGQRLTLARLLPTDGLNPGDYEIEILIRDRVGGQLIENKSKFTIK